MHTSPADPPGRGDAGGMNVHLQELSAALVALGWEVDVLTRRVAAEQQEIRELAGGARLIAIPAGPADPVAKTELATLVGEFASAAGDLARRRSYDVVHSHYWLSGVAGLAIARAADAPHVLNLHTVAAMKNAALAPGDAPERPERLRWEADLVRASAVTVTGTRAERRTIESAYGAEPERVRVIPPGVDLRAFSPQRSGAVVTELAADPSIPAATIDVLRRGGQLVMIARVQPLKGHDIAIRALAAIAPERRPPLVLAGDTSPGHQDFRDRLQAWVIELGLEDLVHFLPAVSRRSAADLLAGAAVLLAPSRSETFGLITLEAAASGTPVIASRVDGLAEAVAEGRSGELVDGFAPADWAGHIDGLLSDPSRLRALGESAREYAHGFGWDRVAAATAEVYQSVIARHPLTVARDGAQPDPTRGPAPDPTFGLVGRHVLFLHAHPDDETIATGGTIARLLAAGTTVSVLTATRGECGESAPGAAPENAGADALVVLRLRELAGALAELGVQQHFWLGTRPARAGNDPDGGERRYSDSGMQWAPDGWAVPAPDVPDTALSLADPDEITADVLALIRAIGPELVVSYDARGGYGHPDHVSLHRAGRAAAALAGVGFAECLPGPPEHRDGTVEDPSDGTAGEVVAVDVRAHRAQVVRALRWYRSQLIEVADDHIVHVGGQRQQLPSVEYFRIR
ncbi:glycosyltransferase [Nakamurella sp. A5-74]|uniref:Glycosyltransferase n=1 Tax=Nakamurella sp. A5-74 TaxID=3158264 RepID=A0AAU8DSD3_9ACTN